PLAGGRGADYAAWAAALAARCGRRVAPGAAGIAPDRASVSSLLAFCSLRGMDFLAPHHWLARRGGGHARDPWFAAALALPVRCYVPVPDAGTLNLPAGHATPALRIAPLGFSARVERLEAALGDRAAALGGAVREAARCFRLDEAPLQRVARALAAHEGPVSA